jgi:hypothetical protein
MIIFFSYHVPITFLPMLKISWLDQMVNTRSNTRQCGANNQSSSPPPPPGNMEQIMVMQTQLMQRMVQAMANVQQSHVQLRDSYGEFMKGCPPIFSHSSEPTQ